MHFPTLMRQISLGLPLLFLYQFAFGLGCDAIYQFEPFLEGQTIKVDAIHVFKTSAMLEGEFRARVQSRSGATQKIFATFNGGKAIEDFFLDHRYPPSPKLANQEFIGRIENWDGDWVFVIEWYVYKKGFERVESKVIDIRDYLKN